MTIRFTECIIEGVKTNKQAYRSGHNEAVLKTVWVKAHGGSNPSACAKNSENGAIHIRCFFVISNNSGGNRGGSRFAREKRFGVGNKDKRKHDGKVGN